MWEDADFLFMGEFYKIVEKEAFRHENNKETCGFSVAPSCMLSGSISSVSVCIFLGYVPSESMEPTIQANSFIIGNRIYSGLFQGDIVILKKTANVW